MSRDKAKVLILCAGGASRWGEYLGVPKQLIPIGNETLLGRSVRLARAKGLVDIAVVSHDDRLRMDGCGFFRPAAQRWIVETFLSTKELWGNRTVVLLGDVFFTTAAISKIARERAPLAFFGRPGPSVLTNKSWEEIFALTFARESHGRLIGDAERALRDAEAGGRGQFWQLYRSLNGLPLRGNYADGTMFRVIDDFTDDFDFPTDYDRSIRRYRMIASSGALTTWGVTGLAWADHFAMRLARKAKNLLQRVAD